MTKKELKLLAKCDGKHKTIDDLFDCKSCAVILNDNYQLKRLEYFRGELRAERMSYGEIAELQSLIEYIEPGDVELLEPAGVPEEIAYDGEAIKQWLKKEEV